MSTPTRADPTPEQLQAALHRIRVLPHCGAWPADVEQVQLDPVRGRLLRLMALRPPSFDPKRAAVGECDEPNPYFEE